MKALGPIALLLAVLPSCGANLLVVQTRTEARTTQGRLVELELDYRPPHGLVHDIDSGVLEFLFGILAEPCDLVASTGIAIDAAFRSDRSVVLGPLGWLASLTPFATLVPGIEFPPMAARTPIDAPTLQALREGDAATRTAAARAALHDDRIVGARVVDPDAQ